MVGWLLVALLGAESGSSIVDGAMHGQQASRLTLLADASDAPGCFKDTECKGDRICVDRVCRDPSGARPRIPVVTTEQAQHLNLVPNLNQRLADIDRQIIDLDVDRPNTVWPSILTTLGWIGVIGGVAAALLISWVAAIPVGGSGLAILIIGTVLLNSRASANRDIDFKIASLLRERRSLLSTASSPTEPLATLMNF